MSRLDREQVPWNLWDVAKAVVVLVFLVAVSSFFKLSFSSSEPIYEPQPILVAIVMFIVYGVLFLVAWLFTVRKYKMSFESLGLGPFDLWDGLRGAVFWLVVVKIFAYVYGILAALLFRFEPSPELVEEVPRLFGTSYIGAALAVFIIAFVAPFVEEIFFRGFVYSAIRKKVGAKWAIPISAVIFAVIHVRLWLIVPVVAIGAVLAYLYEKEGSLGPPIILHCFNNVFSLAILYFFPKLGG